VDHDLVLAARRGDREAFEALARSRGDRLFGIARRILRDVDLAEDAVQDALVIAWRHLPRLRDPERFDSWLTRLLVHRCFAEARRGRRLAANVRALPPSGTPTPDDIQSVIDRDQLERAFDRLSADQRAVLVLHHYLGLGPSEIAATLRIPDGTVRSRMHYALQALRAALEADLRPAEARERVS
jgi:RNA polymerase sigma-70 factor (ECF subfamily)